MQHKVPPRIDGPSGLRGFCHLAVLSANRVVGSVSEGTFSLYSAEASQGFVFPFQRPPRAIW